MRASRESGGSAGLHCSQVGLSSGMVSLLCEEPDDSVWYGKSTAKL